MSNTFSANSINNPFGATASAPPPVVVATEVEQFWGPMNLNVIPAGPPGVTFNNMYMTPIGNPVVAPRTPVLSLTKPAKIVGFSFYLDNDQSATSLNWRLFRAGVQISSGTMTFPDPIPGSAGAAVDVLFDTPFTYAAGQTVAFSLQNTAPEQLGNETCLFFRVVNVV